MGVEVCRRLGLVRNVKSAKRDSDKQLPPALSEDARMIKDSDEDENIRSRVKSHTHAEAACRPEPQGGGFQGEVVSCDSVQVFKGLDVGSGKVCEVG